ncbi:MAG TPA: bifunctional folylpolyglutamate synthase/dihydrofolate synthase, partial [Devosia sp.]|nr:bifunctional folylpolyglutamate synthase/dihydrofolate synthase [Devosia sp.]
PAAFLEPFRPLAPTVLTLTIPGEPNAHKAGFIAEEARTAGFDATAHRGLMPALEVAGRVPRARVVIAGSLYLGGYVLARNGTPPE